MIKNFFVLFFSVIFCVHAQPKLAVVFVVDAFAKHYIDKLNNFFDAGLRKLLDDGVVYTNAFYPHAVLSTAVGHTSLGTGAVPAMHGVIANSWYTSNGTKDELSDKNISGTIMVPSLAEKLVRKNNNNKVIALSLKDRAALGMVGAQLPAIWFDKKTGKFIAQHSNSTISELLNFLNNKINKTRVLNWQPAYADKKYYNFDLINNYEHAASASLFLPELPVDIKMARKKFLDVFVKSPDSNQLLLDGAFWYIEKAYRLLAVDAIFMVWISLSSLDSVGHLYGPDSREAIDTVYHLDKQLDNFINNLSKIIKSKDVFYALTADHGIMPIVELSQKKHVHARRVITSELLKTINNSIEKKFGITNIIWRCDEPNLYLDQQKLKKLSFDQQKKIRKFIRIKLGAYPGIDRAFDTQELAQKKVSVGSTAWHYRNNIYLGRSGDFMFHVAPYSVVSAYKTGTSHYMAQPYDMHVPLILYQPGVLKHKTIKLRVWVNQLTATLAKLFGLERPKYFFEPLPM